MQDILQVGNKVIWQGKDMIRLPFEKLESFERFQSLCVDLLKLEGLKNVFAGGKGPDQGVDLFADIPFESVLGISYHRYIIQCKFKKEKNNVSEKDVGDIISYLDLHNAKGLLFITSSYFSGTSISKMEAINKSNSHPFNITFWDSEELSRRIRKYPSLINTYWYTNKNNSFELPNVDIKDYLKQYEVSPRFVDYSIDSFPVTKYNSEYIQQIKIFAKDYFLIPSLLSVVDGAIFSGKTGFSCSLINEFKSSGNEVALIDDFSFNETYFDFILLGDNHYLSFYNFISNVEYLVFDEFGKNLSDDTDLHRSAISELKRLIDERTSKKLKTIIITSVEYELCSEISNYIKYLSKKYAYIYLGNFSVNKDKKIERYVTHDAPVYLGQGWLLQKYDGVLFNLNNILEIIETPDEVYKAEAVNEKGRCGGKEKTRILEIANIVNHSKTNIERYCKFIESLNFKAIRFDPDGKIELIK